MELRMGEFGGQYRSLGTRSWLKLMRQGACVFVASFASFANAEVGSLLTVLDGMGDGTWERVNANRFSDTWPAPADRSAPGSGYTNPRAVIQAWSGFAWDSNRGDLILWGGGHANYSGNEVYRWRSRDLSWERASMPSKMVEETFIGSNTVPVIVNSPVVSQRVYDYTVPSSAHAYDNNIYLPIADRFLTLGGATAHTGGRFTLRQPDGVVRPTGPYFWDPAKANGDKVGGQAGSANRPEVEAGNMWENRDNQVFRTLSVVSGGTALAEENGNDVVYFIGRPAGGTDAWLYRYEVDDVLRPELDTVSQVGRYFGGPSAIGAGAYDPVSKLFVAMGSEGTPFVAWDLDNASPSNNSFGITPQKVGQFDFGAPGRLPYGIDFDPRLGKFIVWAGGGSVWALDAPDSGTVSGDWSLSLLTDGALSNPADVPAPGFGSGIWGKWKYVSDLRAFVALEANEAGDVWVYRPQGWVNPVPEPSVLMLSFGGLMTLAAFLCRRRG